MLCKVLYFLPRQSFTVCFDYYYEYTSLKLLPRSKRNAQNTQLTANGRRRIQETATPQMGSLQHGSTQSNLLTFWLPSTTYLSTELSPEVRGNFDLQCFNERKFLINTYIAFSAIPLFSIIILRIIDV